MDTAKLREQLIRHEGLRLAAYQDSLGYWTIGVGRLIDSRKGGGISKGEAEYLLDNDMAEVISGLNDALPWLVYLDDVRQRVLADMAFNLGLPGLLKFKNTLAAIKGDDYAAAAAGMLASKWASQVGNRAKRLAKMMETGVDPDQ